MSEVKVNKLSPRSGTTVTIGDSGDTINIVGTLQNNGAAIPGDISSVVAGTGLTGGGTSGDVTLNVVGGTGITANANDIAIDNTVATLNGSQTLTNKSIVATQLTGTIADARITGAYTGITNLTMTGNLVTGGDITTGNNGSLFLLDNAGQKAGQIQTDSSAANALQIDADPDNSASGSYTAFRIDNSEKARIDASGSVGINNTTMASFDADARNLVVGSGSGDNGLTIYSDGSSSGSIFFGNGTSGAQIKQGQIVYEQNNSAMFFSTGASERVRIDSSGNLFVATTTVASDDVGHALLANGSAYHTTDGTYAGLFNRKSSDGTLVQFRKDNTVVGTIGAEGGDVSIGTGIVGLQFIDSQNAIRPFNTTTNSASPADNAIDLGRTVNRFKDLYLGGGAFIGGTSTANKLDDYEEGTWTPAAANTSDWSGFASSTVTPFACTYTKIGRQVTIQGGVSLPDSGDSALAAGDFVQFSGLPFAYGGSGDNVSSKIPSQLFRRDGTNGGVTHGGLTSNTQIGLRVVAVHGNGRRRQQGLNLSFSYFSA